MQISKHNGVIIAGCLCLNVVVTWQQERVGNCYMFRVEGFDNKGGLELLY